MWMGLARDTDSKEPTLAAGGSEESVLTWRWINPFTAEKKWKDIDCHEPLQLQGLMRVRASGWHHSVSICLGQLGLLLSLPSMNRNHSLCPLVVKGLTTGASLSAGCYCNLILHCVIVWMDHCHSLCLGTCASVPTSKRNATLLESSEILECFWWFQQSHFFCLSVY